MEDEIKYMRIGTSLYKVVRRPGLSGSMTKTIIQWSYGAIRQDESKEYIINIPKYDGFCIVPDNINYKRVVGNFYNKYEPINHIRTGDGLYPTALYPSAPEAPDSSARLTRTQHG